MQERASAQRAAAVHRGMRRRPHLAPRSPWTQLCCEAKGPCDPEKVVDAVTKARKAPGLSLMSRAPLNPFDKESDQPPLPTGLECN